MPSGIVHSKWSKIILGKEYSHVHKHMDSPSKGLLKWHHRILRHNPFIHPVYYAIKHKSLSAGLACLQHIIQDYFILFLLWIIFLLLSGYFDLFEEALGISLLLIFLITFFNFIFEIFWMIPQTVLKFICGLLK